MWAMVCAVVGVVMIFTVVALYPMTTAGWGVDPQVQQFWTYVMVGCAIVALVAFVGVYVFIRNRNR
jgi:hypothetical protein